MDNIFRKHLNWFEKLGFESRSFISGKWTSLAHLQHDQPKKTNFCQKNFFYQKIFCLRLYFFGLSQVSVPDSVQFPPLYQKLSYIFQKRIRQNIPCTRLKEPIFCLKKKFLILLIFAFHNIFFYTQLVFVFHFLRESYITCDHILFFAFCSSEKIDTFHKTFFESVIFLF